MKFLRLIQMFLLACIVSGFMFPIEFSFLPAGLNTKMILGVVGILAYLVKCIGEGAAYFRKTTIFSLILAIVFSVWCFFSMVSNGTPDDSYATYYQSFAVWLGGAFAVCSFIKGLHGKVNLQIVVQYLVFVCAAQCVLALLMDNYPGFKGFVNHYVQQGQSFFEDLGRLYGIGAALDPAGCRFAITLTLLSHYISTDKRVIDSKWQLFISISLFLLITLIGNMISRTTSAGAVIGLVYMLVHFGRTRRGFFNKRQVRFWGMFFSLLLVAVSISVWMYFTNPDFMKNIRFAFEAFFNYFETGEFRTSSTDKLNSQMWIWPSTTREWIIGSGWFGSFVYSTDIGYCRFILYCGLVGFIFFNLFFLYNASVVWRKFNDFTFMTFLLIVLMYVIWVKVATDIFWIYALMFCLPDDEPESEPELETEELEE